MKLKSYSLLFRLFSFLADKTGGAKIFVKYKLLFGTIILGFTNTYAQSNKDIKQDTIAVSIGNSELRNLITCYEPVVANFQTSNTLKGIVRDDEKNPLIAVIVSVKGANISAITDVEGLFEISGVEENDTLVFSYLGYESQEYVIKSLNNTIDITLISDNVIMCYEVVVISVPSYKDDIYDGQPKPIESLSIYHVDTEPSFQSGDREAFVYWVKNNINYTPEMIKSGISGYITISCAIDKKGNLVDAKITKSLSKEADKAVLEAVKKSPKWTPGTYNGKNIKTIMDNIYIDFDPLKPEYFD